MYSNVNGVTCLNLLPLSSFSSSSSSSSWYTTVPICLLTCVAVIEPLISGNVYNENRFEISTRLIRLWLQLHYPVVMITHLYLNFDFFRNPPAPGSSPTLHPLHLPPPLHPLCLLPPLHQHLLSHPCQGGNLHCLPCVPQPVQWPLLWLQGWLAVCLACPSHHLQTFLQLKGL